MIRPATVCANGACRAGILILATLLAPLASRAAQSADEVAAAFLFNFAKYVTWPAAALPGDNAPVTIGFVGNAAMADLFAQASKGRNVNGRDLAVKKLDTADGAETCQIVFVSDSSLTGAVLGTVKGKPVLTVGQADVFLAAGGMIAFSKDGSRLVFDVRPGAIKEAGLQVDPKLEKAARAVKNG